MSMCCSAQPGCGEKYGSIGVLTRWWIRPLRSTSAARTDWVPTSTTRGVVGLGPLRLIVSDVLGIWEAFKPKFVRRYAEVAGVIRVAVEAYRDDVKSGAFPGDENLYTISDEAFTEFLALQRRADRRPGRAQDRGDEDWDSGEGIGVAW